MPSRNVLKIDVENSYYHVYARGISRSNIFLDETDYKYFLSLFTRYLSHSVAEDKNKVPYPHFRGKIELLTYCLMTNHFHLLLYQVQEGTMKALMQGVMTSYSRYFNTKYKRSGPLFETRYKASMIIQEDYLQHITRYIHLNPADWREYSYSSLQFYFANTQPEYLEPGRIEELFSGKREYIDFVADYEDNKRILDELQHELANTITT